MVDELKVSFSIQDEFLSLGFLIGFDLLGPLVLEHLLLSGFFLCINVLCLGNRVLLPSEDVEGLLDLLLLKGTLLLLP